ncbi:MAG: aspartate kinase [Acidobacteriota bacterium]
MRVLKFGGTSLADGERMADAAQRVEEARGDGPVVAVVSALAGVTDDLTRAAEHAAKGGRRRAQRRPPRGGSESPGPEEVRSRLGLRHLLCLEELGPPADVKARTAALLHRRLVSLATDLQRLATAVAQGESGRRERTAVVLAAGERLAAPLFTAALAARGLDAEVVDTAELIVTEGPILDGRVIAAATRDAARQRLAVPLGSATPRVQVVPGFVAADRQGRTTLLGRGGSDVTATALAAALDAHRVEIWTDVDGVMSADPKVNPGAALLPRLRWGEAAALAKAGAKVLHPRAVEPAAAARIPIQVRNSLRPDGPGTWIGDAGEDAGEDPKRLVRSA